MNQGKANPLSDLCRKRVVSAFIGFMFLCLIVGVADCNSSELGSMTGADLSAQSRNQGGVGTHGPTRVAGVDGTRVFWIQTSVLSNSGGSGYVHFCPGGVVYTSSEGSFLLSRAGGAHRSRGAGVWRLTQNRGYPYVAVRFNDGSTGGYWVNDLTSGRSWRVGQYKYAAEQGRATCP